MDVVTQFNAEVPKFAIWMCQLANKVQQLADTDDIKALKEERCHWDGHQKQSLQEFVASKQAELNNSIAFACTYQEYLADYLKTHPRTLEDVRWSVYGLLEADFFNHCQLRWLMNLVICNISEPNKSVIINFYNSCVIRSLKSVPTDVHPHCLWLLDHLQELMPGQMFSLLWQLHRHRIDTAVPANLYRQVYNSCRVDLSIISALGFVGSLPLAYMLQWGGTGAEFEASLFVVSLVACLAVFILPLIGIYVLRPQRY